MLSPNDNDSYEKLGVLLSEIARLRLLSAQLDKQILKVQEAVEVWYQKHNIVAKADFEAKTHEIP